MSKILLFKDIKLLLKDLKFQIFFLILVILFILSAISSTVNYQNLSMQFQSDFNQHNERVADGKSTQMIQLLSYGNKLHINNRPSPIILFSNYDNYPDKVSTEVMFFTPSFSKYGTAVREIFRLNWHFILGVLAGLIMLILSFEAISYEKRAGTLRLLSIYGFKRQVILWHKYLSYMLLYLIIIIPPALMSLVLFFTLTGTWSMDFMLRFLLILLISIPFASFFVLLGIFISMGKNYRNAIVMIVFIWLLFVIIIPQFANIIAKQISPMKPNIEYNEMGGQAWNTEWDIWGEQYRDSVWGNHLLHDGIRAKAVHSADEKRSNVYQIKIDDGMRQTRIIENIASLSPFTQFERISEVIFDKGSYLFGHLSETAKRTIAQVRNLMIEQDSRDENSQHLFYSWAESDGSWGSIDPPFSHQLFDHPDLLFVTDIPTDDVLHKSLNILLRLLPILCLNLLLVVCSVIKLERLDIR